MTYNEFRKWCEQRSQDGLWSAPMAISCYQCINDVDRRWKFKREKYFQEAYAETVEQALTNWKKLYNRTGDS